MTPNDRPFDVWIHPSGRKPQYSEAQINRMSEAIRRAPSASKVSAVTQFEMRLSRLESAVIYYRPFIEGESLMEQGNFQATASDRNGIHECASKLLEILHRVSREDRQLSREIDDRLKEIFFLPEEDESTSRLNRALKALADETRPSQKIKRGRGAPEFREKRPYSFQFLLSASIFWGDLGLGIGVDRSRLDDGSEKPSPAAAFLAAASEPLGNFSMKSITNTLKQFKEGEAQPDFRFI